VDGDDNYRVRGQGRQQNTISTSTKRRRQRRTTKNNNRKERKMVETRQSRLARVKQNLPIQPLVSLNVEAGERFLPKLPEFITAAYAESSPPTVTTIAESPKTDQVQQTKVIGNTLPACAVPVTVVPERMEHDLSGPKVFRPADHGVRIYAAKTYVRSHYTKGKQIICGIKSMHQKKGQRKICGIKKMH